MISPSTTGRLQIEPKYLLIFLLPVAVLILSEYILGTFGDTGIIVPTVELQADTPFYELSARYKFLAALFFFCAVTLALTAIFIVDIYTWHTKRSALYTGLGIASMILVSLSFSILEPDWMPAGFESQSLLGNNLFHTVLGAGRVPGCEAGGVYQDACAGNGAFFAMKHLLDHANILTSLAAAAVIAGMVLALARPARALPATTDGLIAKAGLLKAAQEATQRYLYCSGILLTTGMILVMAWMTWPGPAISDDAIREAHQELVTSLSMYRGVTYSVLILSFYLPVSLILKFRIDRFKLALEQAGTPEVADDVKGFDMQRIASLDALKAIIAIVSPILTSAIGSFANISAFG